METAPQTPHFLPRVPKFSVRVPGVFKKKKFWISFFVALLGIVSLSYFLLYLPAMEVVKELELAKDSGTKLQDSFANQDAVKADKELDELEVRLEKSRVKLDYFGFTSSLPWLGDYYKDARHLLLSAQYGTEAGKVVTQALLPYADDISFESGKQVTTEQKIQAILPIMPKIAPVTDSVSAKLNLVKKELESVDPDRYPTELQGYRPRELLASAKEWVEKINAFMPEAKEVLTLVPGALGSPKAKRYFVLFQNDKELRPTGGFLTAYTYMNVTGGKITTLGSENITKIDDNMRRTFPAPAPILKYLPLVHVWNPRDANLSPDFVTSMRKFEELASYSSAYSSADGIIAVDTFLLQELLRLTGPIKVIGDTFTPENVVEKLEIYAEQVFVNTNNRKAFLGDLMKEILHRLTTAGKEQWMPIIETAIRAGNEKHFLLYSKDASVQGLIEKYNWGGRIKSYDGDYLHINDTNFAGAKANLYVKEKIIQEYTIDNDGTITKKVTVEVTNPVKTDGWLNGPYRDWIRMYVPKGSEFVKYDGGEVKTSTTADELGKAMFESFFIARPLNYSTSNKATWSVTYKLPFKATGKELKLLQQKQPGVEGPELQILINGKVRVSEQLRTDKEFTLAI